MGGSQTLERPNVKRPIFRKFETSNIEITKVEFYKLSNFKNLLIFETQQFQKYDFFFEFVNNGNSMIFEIVKFGKFLEFFFQFGKP